MGTLEYLEKSVHILVLLHMGVLKVSCSDCSPEMMVELNHNLDERGEAVLFVPEMNMEFYACPIAMLPPLVFNLYDKYYYYKEYGNTPRYEDCDNLYWWFVKTYNGYYNKYEAEKIKETYNK